MVMAKPENLKVIPLQLQLLKQFQERYKLEGIKIFIELQYELQTSLCLS